ncbi:MAG: hypothetical protein IKO43_01945 [Kiritimatiellae bacterium]|nr:hypothetical protein [Kiritimatiellia bacterium]
MKKIFSAVAAAALATVSAEAAIRISVIGDSISTFNGIVPSGYPCYYPKGDVANDSQMYWQIICDRLGAEREMVEAWSGSRVTYNSSTASFNATSRYTNLGNPDIILVHGGTNDRGVTLGTQYAAGEWDDTSIVSYYRPAMSRLIEKLQETYPDAMIYWLMDSNIITGDRAASFREICAYYGITCIEMSGVTYIDSLHPDVAGMVRMADVITPILDADISAKLGYGTFAAAPATAVALDTRTTAAGNLRSFEWGDGTEVLPFAAVNTGSWQIREVVGGVTNAWRVGTGEQTVEWSPSAPGIYEFVHEDTAGNALSAKFAVSLSYVSGGSATEVGAPGTVATVSVGGVALDTCATASGNTRTLDEEHPPLPFALSGSYGADGAAGAWSVAVTAPGASEAAAWASGEAEAVRAWEPDTAGTTLFTLTASDGTELAARFAASLSFVSGGTASDVGGAGTVTTVRLEGIPLDTTVSAGGARAVEDAGDVLPVAASGDWATGAGAWAVTLSYDGYEESVASGAAETAFAWQPPYEGTQTLMLTDATGGVSRAVFTVAAKAAKFPTGGGTINPSVGGEASVALLHVALDTRSTKAGNLRELASEDELLDFAASGSGFERGVAAKWTITETRESTGTSAEAASGTAETVFAWRPYYAGTNTVTLVAANGDTLTARFALPDELAQYTDTGDIGGESGDEWGEAAVSFVGVALDTRATAANNTRTVTSTDEILPIAHYGAAGAPATVTVSFLGAASGDSAQFTDEGTSLWTPAGSGTWVLVHESDALSGSVRFVFDVAGNWLDSVGMSAMEPEDGGWRITFSPGFKTGKGDDAASWFEEAKALGFVKVRVATTLEELAAGEGEEVEDFDVDDLEPEYDADTDSVTVSVPLELMQRIGGEGATSMFMRVIVK